MNVLVVGGRMEVVWVVWDWGWYFGVMEVYGFVDSD